MEITTNSRRPHRKSRNGCKRCKVRKVKCDELKPQCTNCQKHSVECDFINQSPAPPASRGGSAYTPVYGAQTNFGPLPPDQVPLPYVYPQGSPRDISSQKADGQYENGSPLVTPPMREEARKLNMLDLELLHNFAISTSYTFHADPAIKTLWRINVPQVAFQFDFVMRGVLALSALHIAHHSPGKAAFYQAQADLHHKAGLLQATSLFKHDNITAETCTPIYIFTAMSCLFQLASTRKANNLMIVGDSGIPEWLVMFRGISAIVNSWQEVLSKDTLGPMFIAGSKRHALRNQVSYSAPSEPNDALDTLVRQIRLSTPSPQDLDIYEEAIQELRQILAFVYSQSPQQCESGDVFIWLFRVSVDYLELLRNMTQQALAIFAFFCVVPNRLETSWWIGGWSSHLMAQIYPSLDEVHKLWVRWPIEEIGWVPN